MMSAVFKASCRVAIRIGNKAVSPTFTSNFNSMRTNPIQPAFFALQQFSTAPPLFLDSAEVTERIMAVVKKFDQVYAEKVTPETKFATDLGLDSLDIVEVVMAIEDEFAIEIPDQEADKILSIADAVAYISSHPMAK